MLGKLDCRGCSGRPDRVCGKCYTVCRRADRFDLTRLPFDIFECEEKPTALLTEALRLSVDKKLYLVSAGDDVNVLFNSLFVIPVTDDVRPRMFDIDPTIPHHLMREVAVFWDS